MNQILILYEGHQNDWTINEWKRNGLNAVIQFKRMYKVLRAIRRFWIRKQLPMEQLWYRNWNSEVRSADLIILHISSLNMHMASYLNKINPKARIIAWYWNIVEENTLPSKLKGKCELWSFDSEDCKKYGMSFNHQYYFKSLVLPSTTISYDVYFVGNDFKRRERVLHAYQKLKALNLRVFFQVVRVEEGELPEEVASARVSYDDIRQIIAKSQAILEIVREGQSGATLRVLEAMFFQKKLITDNKNVMQEEFFDPERIFVLGQHPLEEIPAFLENPFKPYDQEIIDRYDVKQWIDNFTSR